MFSLDRKIPSPSFNLEGGLLSGGHLPFWYTIMVSMWWCTISKWLCNWYQYAPIWVPSFLNALVKWGRPAPKHLLNNMWESSMALQDPILYCGWRPPTQNWDLQFLDFDQFISMILNGTWGAHLRVCRVFFSWNMISYLILQKQKCKNTSSKTKN